MRIGNFTKRRSEIVGNKRQTIGIKEPKRNFFFFFFWQ